METNKKQCPYCNEEIDINETVCPICCETLPVVEVPEEYHCPYCNEVIDPTEEVCPICCETLTPSNPKPDTVYDNTPIETNTQEEYYCPFCNEVINPTDEVCPICCETLSSYNSQLNIKDNTNALERNQTEQSQDNYRKVACHQNNIIIIILSSLLIVSIIIILFLIIGKSHTTESNQINPNNIQTESTNVSQQHNKTTSATKSNTENINTIKNTDSALQNYTQDTKPATQQDKNIVKQTKEDEITIYKKHLAKRLDTNWRYNPLINEDLTATIECRIGRNGKVIGICRTYKSSGRHYYDSQAESYVDGTIGLNPMPLPQSFTENELIIRHTLTYKAPKTQQVAPNNLNESSIKQNDIQKSTDALFE